MKEVCQGTNNGITVVEDLPENRIASLRNRYDGCKYVDGNLEITGLDHDDFYDKDLSFLNSIQEVPYLSSLIKFFAVLIPMLFLEAPGHSEQFCTGFFSHDPVQF